MNANTIIRTLRGVGAASSSQRSGISINAASSTTLTRLFSATTATQLSSLPESITRVGEATAFPNEFPGQNYMFNWCLNADGVTPLKKSAFRITKPLDLKVAGLQLPTTSPLNVNAKSEKNNMPEAGSDELDFDTFDDVLQSTKDGLSMSDSLFCPEGYAPGTRTGVRVISNVGNGFAPDLVGYLDRHPKRDPKGQAITCYVLSDAEEFSGYAIEEVEESGVAISVATVVVSGKAPSLKRVVAGIELSAEGLEADAKEREEKKAADEQAAA